MLVSVIRLEQCACADLLSISSCWFLDVEGNRFFIGFSRSLKTLRLMYQKLSTLLCLMLGRMFLWLGTQSIITVFTVFLEREFLLSTEAFGPLLLIYFVCGAISALGASFVVSKFPSYTLAMFKVREALFTALTQFW